MFKAIHGLAPHYLCNDVTMIIDAHGYNTRSSENINLYVPKYTKEICKRSFAYKGNMPWNDLLDELKEFSSLDAFKSTLSFLHWIKIILILWHSYLLFYTCHVLNTLAFYFPVCIWYDVGIQLFYIIATISSNYCISYWCENYCFSCIL